MKLYMTINEVFDSEAFSERLEILTEHNVEPQIAYLFFASYAELAVRAIIGGVGKDFSTFVPPDYTLTLEQLRGMWGVDKVAPIHYYGSLCQVENDVRTSVILAIVEHVWRAAGLTIEEGVAKTKVSLLMNEIGNALICVEC